MVAGGTYIVNPVVTAVVILMFVGSGSLSTLSTKWLDSMHAVGRDGQMEKVAHPFCQTWIMFLGEFVCLPALLLWRYVKLKRSPDVPYRRGIETWSEDFTPKHWLLFLAPALCDFSGTSAMYVGLTYTQASVYQMLRGAVVLFTALIGMAWLKRRLQLFQWLGVTLVICGLTCIGVASIAGGGTGKSSNPGLGDGLIIAAQVIVALQMNIEEKLMTKYDVPAMLLVGCEGVAGLLITSIALGLFQLWPVHSRPDDFIDYGLQLSNNGTVVLATFLMWFSIPTLNATGNAITGHLNATTRMVLDTVRNIVVWVVTLALPGTFGAKFSWLQAVGFVVLVSGTTIYNRVLRLPCAPLRPKLEDAKIESDDGGDDADEANGVVHVNAGGHEREPLLSDE